MGQIKHARQFIWFPPRNSIRKEYAIVILDRCGISNFICENKNVVVNCINGFVSLKTKFLKWEDKTEMVVEYDYNDYSDWKSGFECGVEPEPESEPESEPEPEEKLMIEETLNKRVNVFLTNGSALDGFMASINRKFCKLVELNNNVVIFKTENIDVVRIINSAQQVQEELQEEKPVKEKSFVLSRKVGPNLNPDDFCMVNDSSTYNAPSFVRTTPRGTDAFTEED
jgi:sRNA-binding regulator protein Hfq